MAIALIGIGMAALHRPTKVWSMVLPLFQVTLCLTAVLGLLFRRGAKRAYWIGFAIFGCAFFLLFLVVFWGPHVVTNGSGCPHILAEPLGFLLELFMLLGHSDMEGFREDLVNVVSVAQEVDADSRLLVTTSVIGISFAMLGGTIARAFDSSEKVASPPSGPSSTAPATES